MNEMSDQDWKKIYDSIQEKSKDNPNAPEFPPWRTDHARKAGSFSATREISINIPKYGCVIIKDESENEVSGTHKDRLAWEIVVLYKYLIQSKLDKRIKTLPKFSLISSGSAAIAIGRFLEMYRLPRLKVLVSNDIAKNIHEEMLDAHCEVFLSDLSKPLSYEDICSLTNNPEGLDLTSLLENYLSLKCYDWLACEILKHRPKFVFMPFGTGLLFKGLIEMNRLIVEEMYHNKPDPRLENELKNHYNPSKCSFIGAIVNNKTTKADKLYAAYRPFGRITNNWLKLSKFTASCGAQTCLKYVHERYLEKAYSFMDGHSIKAEYSGAAGLALYMQLKDFEPELLPEGAKVVVVNTGKLRMKKDIKLIYDPFSSS